MGLFSEKIHERVYVIGYSAIAFCLLFARLTPFIIALVFLNWLLEADFGAKFRAIAKNRLAVIFISFYLLHIIGLLFTENMNSGLFDIQVKLSLFVFPILFASKPVDNANFGRIFYSLILGGVLSSLYLIGNALSIYLTSGVRHFFYTEFSVLLHPSYMSMYLNVCIAWLFFKILKDTNEESQKLPIWLLAGIMLFFSLVVVLLSSKLGEITLFLLYIYFIGYYIVKKKKIIQGLVASLIVIAGLCLTLMYVPEVRSRVDNAVNAMTNKNIDKQDSESTAARILVWQAAREVIAQNWVMGVGTGDAKQALLDEYQRQGMTGAYEHRLNAHNEFYQVFIALGVVGFLFLLLTIFLPMVEAFKDNDWFYVVFLLIIILNFLTESMLETEAGVIFIAFFNSLCAFRKR